MSDDEEAGPTPTPTEMIAVVLSDKADWRRRETAQLLHDWDNLVAADLLDRLAIEVLALEGSAAGTAFEKEHNAIFSGKDPGRARDVVELWSDYLASIGLQLFPDTGEEVLQSLLDLARSAPGA